MINTIWIVMVPFTCGFFASWIYFKLRSRKKPPRFLDGFVAWLVFLTFAFLGEILAHAVYPNAYDGIGDNPAQVAGLVYSILFSFVTNPLLYFFFTRRRVASP